MSHDICRDACVTAFVGILALLAVAYALSHSPPVVEKGWPSKSCVRVIPASAGDCSHLPKRYEQVWVSDKNGVVK